LSNSSQVVYRNKIKTNRTNAPKYKPSTDYFFVAIKVYNLGLKINEPNSMVRNQKGLQNIRVVSTTTQI